ncbi:hypothetical protein [Sedimentitalea arenosa]|uniref:Lipoprotein n=1 Tax=Sedimentitalea arenosa TaxID=2798803 RepID=A0A8J7LQW1_9RHOB|nr:hypothetical protein [Arenibacterium arenosum]MBJ6371323.1 hypothetical protein [Arenibacterium arenosum]
MKTPILLTALALGVAGCSTTNPFDPPESTQVQVMGRTWTVTAEPDRANAFVAERDNNNLNPFGGPAAQRTPQAVRALQLATGCKVVPGRISQDVGAIYHADMACPG